MMYLLCIVIYNLTEGTSANVSKTNLEGIVNYTFIIGVLLYIRFYIINSYG